MSSRRNFLQQTALGLAGTVAIPYVGKAAIAGSFQPAPFAGAEPLQVGVAGYTFAKFNLEQSIAMMKRIGVTNLSLKEFHLPLNSSQETVDATMAKLK
ncbi:MAG TPA: hypothetical protein VG842_05490, partial [Sediminibacterium sp.]|nr:hypothetical protein [Sediminibacterium sp.]